MGLTPADCAQTNVRLYRQLLESGYSPDDVARVARAYALAMRLFTGQFRGSGKPFLAHLVGTASVLGSVHAPADVVVAGLLHAAYAQGEFGTAWRGLSAAKRAEVRAAAGDDAEVLVARYTALPWTEESVPALLERLDALDDLDRTVILVRLANELEDYLDLGVLHGGHAGYHRQWAEALGPACVEIARRLGFSALAAELAGAFEDALSGVVPPALQRREPSSFLLAPASHTPRLRVVASHLLARILSALHGARPGLRRPRVDSVRGREPGVARGRGSR